MDEQHVYHRSEPNVPTWKAKVGRDGQGRVYWEVTTEAHSSASELAMALANAVSAVQAEVRALGGTEA